MNRINQTIKKNQKKTKSDQKEIPTFGVDGNVIIPGKKERQKKIKKVIIIASTVALFIYIPQFFMKGTSSSEKNKLAVSLDVSAVKRSTDAMKENSAADFDSDGIDNGEEQNQNTNCWFLDSDQDGLTDYCEIYITKTNPNKADIGYLIDKQKTEDEKKGKKVSSPYKIGNVILWADNYTSKAYGSVVETTRGYRFSKFSGYAQFPNSSGKYYYRLKDGIRTPLAYRADENVYRIEPYDTIEVYDKKLPRIIDLSIFGKHIYLNKNKFSSILATVLPSKGFISAQAKCRMDIEPDTRESTSTDIIKIEYDKEDASRYTMNTNSLSNLQYVRETIKKGSCVEVSLYKPSKGEYIGIIYGYTYEGDLLIADADTLEPIGTLKITETAKKIMNNDGDLVSYSYFDFKGLGFDSKKFDRICFFAATNDNIQNRMQETEETTK